MAVDTEPKDPPANSPPDSSNESDADKSLVEMGYAPVSSRQRFPASFLRVTGGLLFQTSASSDLSLAIGIQETLLDMVLLQLRSEHIRSLRHRDDYLHLPPAGRRRPRRHLVLDDCRHWSSLPRLLHCRGRHNKTDNRRKRSRGSR